jgi:SAM-dependent methyltransferase
MDANYIVKKITPSPVRKLIRIFRDRNTHQEFDGLTLPEKFTKIYHENWWGKYRSDDVLEFDSGKTSHLNYMLEEYVNALASLVETRKDISSVVDLGCGDFNVGKRISPLFEKYTGVDIVESLIKHNQDEFGSKTISFICKDITADKLPKADLICIRQVLQHLSNADIQRFLDNIEGNYKFLVVTETMHKSWRFKANKDIVSGPGVRFHKKSGVVLHASPFHLNYKEMHILCEPALGKEFVRTTLYKL